MHEGLKKTMVAAGHRCDGRSGGDARCAARTRTTAAAAAGRPGSRSRNRTPRVRESEDPGGRVQHRRDTDQLGRPSTWRRSVPDRISAPRASQSSRRGHGASSAAVVDRVPARGRHPRHRARWRRGREQAADPRTAPNHPQGRARSQSGRRQRRRFMPPACRA